MKFKIGDKVRVKSNLQANNYSVGYEFIISDKSFQPDGAHGGVYFPSVGNGMYGEDLEIISNIYKNMNMLEKFALTFKTEPEKSFRKAGIIDSNDTLTADGQKIFLSWLLKDSVIGPKFKTEVVDELLKKDEE